MSRQFEPLTSENRVRDFVLPTEITLGKELLFIPDVLRDKDAHFLLNEEGKPVRAAWINKALAFILNSQNFIGTDTERTQLQKAVYEIEGMISTLIKERVLKDRRGPGAMSFAQAHENVPVDSILITERTFNKLCDVNPAWRKARTVVAVRFPNLGPNTTMELKLIVQSASLSNYSFNSLGNRLPQLAHLLDEVEEHVEEQLIDSIYLNPETLKDKMQGDGDGDQVFIVIEKRGKPTFKNIELIREPGNISDADIDLLFHKANRTERTSLKDWLGPYFDNVPIGPATYCIRWKLDKLLEKYKDKPNPMHWAWKELAPWAIELIEFVMDIRKGEWTEAQIDERLKEISTVMKEIKAAQEDGNWFAKTVTSSSVLNPGLFVSEFTTLQSYLDRITKQKRLENLLDE